MIFQAKYMTECEKKTSQFNHKVIYIYICVYILGSSAHVARALAYRIILQDYTTGLYYGTKLRDYITDISDEIVSQDFITQWHYGIKLWDYITELCYRIILWNSNSGLHYGIILWNYITELDHGII